MTKAEFFAICDKADIKGDTQDFSTEVIWIPEGNWFIRIMYDTDGNQLMYEDILEGYDNYIDYKINLYTNVEDVLFEEDDGGIWLYNNKKSDIQEVTWNFLVNCLNMPIDEIKSIVWLDTNKDLL